jgi:hypothetical protein
MPRFAQTDQGKYGGKQNWFSKPTVRCRMTGLIKVRISRSHYQIPQTLWSDGFKKQYHVSKFEIPPHRRRGLVSEAMSSAQDRSHHVGLFGWLTICVLLHSTGSPYALNLGSNISLTSHRMCILQRSYCTILFVPMSKTLERWLGCCCRTSLHLRASSILLSYI